LLFFYNHPGASVPGALAPAVSAIVPSFDYLWNPLWGYWTSREKGYDFSGDVVTKNGKYYLKQMDLNFAA
jgi:hypothetical protein